MPRGGVRPGAGRPPKHAAEMKRDKAAKQLSRCKEEIQENLLDLTKAAIEAAKGGDKALLKFLLEQGIGKAPVMQTATPDTQIQVVLGNIPRPNRKADDADEPVSTGAVPLLGEDGLDEPPAEEEAAVLE